MTDVDRPNRRPEIVPRPSTVFSDIDLDREGKQTGFFHIPHSPHEDAWGTVRIPLAVVKSGEGPTVLVEGGNHGDEYEGPIAITEFFRDVDPGEIHGRVIAIPAINLPAVAAGRRASPDDDLNFNRVFPGDPNGTITRQIAAYVHDHLFPLSDVFLDLHSGGSSLMITPSAIIEPAPDPAHHRRNIEAALAFGAPKAVVVDNLGDPRTATASAVAAGLTAVATEMGGAGTVTPEALAICRRGLRNVLAHAGVIDPSNMVRPAEAPRVYTVAGKDAYVIAGADGVFEALLSHGAAVRIGDVVGRIHSLVDPWRAPVDLTARTDGIVFALRQPGHTRIGNCCIVIAEPYDWDG